MKIKHNTIIAIYTDDNDEEEDDEFVLSLPAFRLSNISCLVSIDIFLASFFPFFCVHQVFTLKNKRNTCIFCIKKIPY